MFNFLRKRARQLPAATTGQLRRIEYLRKEAGVAGPPCIPETALEAELIIGRLQFRHGLGNSNEL
jgi:hypothetical protein